MNKILTNKRESQSVSINIHMYSTAQSKLDTRVQQKYVCLTDFVETLASGLRVACMAHEYAW